jgi:hypothetical protein
MAGINEQIEAYLEGTRQLRAAVAGMTREQLLARPVAGKMSTLEVVCHLADFEPIIADRMKRVITHDRPQLLGADENRFKDGLFYHDRDIEEELAIIDMTRAQMARILRRLPAEAFKRVGVHSERGELTLERLLSISTNHIPHHLPFIAEKRQALGLPPA